MANDKELAKSSEIPTLTLRIGSLKFIKENKITTKIIFSKKQFIWEIGDEDTKSQSKRKFELKFSDIEKIDVSIENSSIRIGKLMGFFMYKLLKRDQREAYRI